MDAAGFKAASEVVNKFSLARGKSLAIRGENTDAAGFFNSWAALSTSAVSRAMKHAKKSCAL